MPEEVAKAQDQNNDARELDNVGQRAVELFHEEGKHGCQGQRGKALRKGQGRGGDNGRRLPEGRPVERIVERVGRLGDQDGGCLVVAPLCGVRHDLGAGENLDVRVISAAVILLLRSC